MLKTKTIKKLLSILCCVALLAGIIPTSVFAEVKNRGDIDVMSVDFDNDSALATGKIDGELISSYNGDYNCLNVVEGSSGKYLKAELNEKWKNDPYGWLDWHDNFVRELWRVNDGKSFVVLEPGKTYTVTFDYMLESAASALEGFSQNWRNCIYIGYGKGEDDFGTYGNFTLGVSTKVIDNFEVKSVESDGTVINNNTGAALTDTCGNTVKEGQWNTVTYEITPESGRDDYKLYIFSSMLTGNTYCYDNIKVVEKDKTVSHVDFSKALINGSIGDSVVAGRSGTYNAFSSITENDEKMLKISVPSAFTAPNSNWGICDWDTGLWFLNNGDSFITLQAGKTYTVTVRYKLNSCTKQVSELDSSVNWRRNALLFGYGTKAANWYENGDITPGDARTYVIDSFDKPAIDAGTHKDINGTVIKVGQWTTANFEITPEAGANDYRLWMFTRILTGTEIYISDVVVAEKTEEMGITFEDTSYGIDPIINGNVAGQVVSGRNSATYNVFSAAEDSGNKVLKASVPSYFVGTGNSAWGMIDWDANLWFVNDGMQYITMEHGKAYNITLKYKVASCTNNASDLAEQVGGWRNTLSVGYGTADGDWGTYGSIVPASTNIKILTGFERSSIENGFTDVSGNTVEIGKWNTVSVDIIPEAGSDDYRLWLCATSLTGTEILIDDISITVWDGKRVTVVDLNGSKTKDIISIEELTAPTAEGFTFTGWYSDSECTTPATFDDLALDGAKIYAGYEANDAVLGDINADGEFSILDLVRAKKLSAQEKVDITTAPELDLNGTGTVDAATAIASLRKGLLGAKALEAPTSGVYFAGANAKGYSVVLPTELRTVMVTAAAENLATALGVELTASSESNYQILIGEEVAGLEAGSYVIKLSGKKVIISAGIAEATGNDDVLAAAINRLTEFVTKSDGKLLSFKHNINFTCKPSFFGSAYRYSWGDEFNDGNVDKSVWTGFNPSRETPYASETDEYKTVNARDELIWEAYGVLSLPMINDTDSKHIKGSAVSTENKVAFKYGLYETRAKIADPYSGAATAIWLWSFHDKQSCFDATNEIDLLENFARASNYKYDENTVKYGAGTLNYHAAAGDAADEDKDTWSRVNSYFNDKDSRYFYTTDENAPTEWNTFHIYSVDWQPDRIVWYIDGKEIQRLEKSALTEEQKAIVDKAFEAAIFPVFSAGVSGYNSTYSKVKPATGAEVWNTDLRIDYVRLYQNDNGELRIYN